MQTHHSFPKSSSANIYLFKKTSLEPVLETEAKDDSNILLERKYLKTFWQMFRIELSVQLSIAFAVGYTVFGFSTKTFNNSAFRAILGIGLS